VREEYSVSTVGMFGFGNVSFADEIVDWLVAE